MKITIKTAHGFLSAQPPTPGGKPGGLVRWQYREVAGAWETFDVDGFVFPAPPAPPPPPPPGPPVYDPIVGLWPPPAGTPRVRPPDVASIDPTQVKRELRWSLWAADSSDDESYWMDVVLLKPEPGHTPGWVDDSYWFDKIAAGDGAEKGYVWPPQ